MKQLFFALSMALLSSCSVSKPTKQEDPNIQIRVTKIEREGAYTKVWGRRSYMFYRAEFLALPDSVKVGTILTLQPYNKRPSGDSNCVHVFSRIN